MLKKSCSLESNSDAIYVNLCQRKLHSTIIICIIYVYIIVIHKTIEVSFIFEL